MVTTTAYYRPNYDEDNDDDYYIDSLHDGTPDSVTPRCINGRDDSGVCTGKAIVIINPSY